MALDVVTDGKNDKTEKNGWGYVHNKRTRDGTCVLFCVPPSFALIDNKYILLCAIIRSPLNESNEELRIKQQCLYLHSSFRFFSRLCNQCRDNLELLPFIFGGPK